MSAPDTDHPACRPDLSGLYEITLRGQLDDAWATWFGGAAIVVRDGDTVVTCRVRDQSALHGVLKKVRDLGIPLVSLACIPDPAPDAGAHQEGTHT